MKVFAILVAFKVKEPRSIKYSKCADMKALHHSLDEAERIGAEFISIRFPRE